MAESGAWHSLAKSNMKFLYYSVSQQVAHHAVTGCNLSTGDILGSGTISGTEKNEFGSLMELSWGGKEPITLTATGEERTFIQDGDCINMTGYAQGDGYTIGFGDCKGKILPAQDLSLYF